MQKVGAGLYSCCTLAAVTYVYYLYGVRSTGAQVHWCTGALGHWRKAGGPLTRGGLFSREPCCRCVGRDARLRRPGNMGHHPPLVVPAASPPRGEEASAKGKLLWRNWQEHRPNRCVAREQPVGSVHIKCRIPIPLFPISRTHIVNAQRYKMTRVFQAAPAGRMRYKMKRVPHVPFRVWAGST